MSNKSFTSENATPEEMREELDKFFAHVQQHDPKSLKFALMVAGHGEANGDTHVRSMIGGTPQTLAYIITELIDELIKQDPTFATFFVLNFLQRDADVKEMLNKIRSVH